MQNPSDEPDPFLDLRPRVPPVESDTESILFASLASPRPPASESPMAAVPEPEWDLPAKVRAKSRRPAFEAPARTREFPATIHSTSRIPSAEPDFSAAARAARDAIPKSDARVREERSEDPSVESPRDTDDDPLRFTDELERRLQSGLEDLARRMRGRLDDQLARIAFSNQSHSP